MDIQNEIKAVFSVLQGLDIKATPNNVSIMDAVYNSLRAINSELEAKENVGDTESRPADSPV